MIGQELKHRGAEEAGEDERMKVMLEDKCHDVRLAPL